MTAESPMTKKPNLLTVPPVKRYWLRPVVEWVRNHGIAACEAKAQQIAQTLAVGTLVNVGGGCKSTRWPTAQNCDGMLDAALDFNTCALPWPDAEAGVVVCEQVVEHLHNTTWFLAELYRITKPGGTLLLATENLASLPNLFALLCQRAPFSTQAVCGQFIGGWRGGIAGEGVICQPNHPAFAGLRGHVRVMTVGQIKPLLEGAGFQVVAKHGFGGNHYVLLHAKRPLHSNYKATEG